MQVDKEMTEYVSGLSRLELTAPECETLTTELEHILSYMEVLSGLDTAELETTGHVTALKNVFRPDEIAPSMDRNALLKQAPSSDGASFLVPGG